MRAAQTCGWPLRSAAAMPGEAGFAGSHLARPAAEQRTCAINTFVNHTVCLSQVLIGPGAELDPAMGVQWETQSLALKTKLRGDQIGDLHRR